MTRTHNQALWSALFLLAGACSGGGEQKDSQSSLTPVTRAIVGIIPAADIGGGGQPVDPGFTFPPGAPKITIVAHAGEATGSPMGFTWFQVTEAGEERLFTHTVEVGSFQAGYSVGMSPGTLTPGAYRVEATFEGETSSTKFQVQAPEAEASAASSAGAGAPAGGATGQGATSGPPASGDSGAVATPSSDPPRSGEAYAYFDIINEPVDPGPPGIAFVFNAGRPGGGGSVEAQAHMGDNFRLLAYPLTSQQDYVATVVEFNPCVHPGGSDLPGTKASFDVGVVESDGAIRAGGGRFTTLGPDETEPEVTINSQPPNNSRVEPGDQIVLDATAKENRDGPTWQEGLRSFKLTANPGGLVGEEQRSDSPVAQPCGRKQWSLASQATYHVPDDAPPVIKICGVALDFAGNFNDPTKCNEYYTGEVWEGPLTGQFYAPVCSGGAITGDLKIVVGDNGMVTGSVTEKRAAFSCGTAEGPALERTNQFTGRKTAGAFELSVYGVVVTLPIVGTHATATSDHPGAPGWGVKYTYTVDCVSCG